MSVIMPIDHAAWLKERKFGIGASDAGAILGKNRWKSNLDLWREKTGEREPEDIGDKPQVAYGKAAEEFIRGIFTLDHPELAVTYDSPYKIIRSDDLNDSSLIIRVDYGERSFLFPGDASDGVIEDSAYIGGYDLDCDVLKLGHHGSSTSTDEDVLDITTPGIAVASCGLDNSYGHPHQEVVDLLAQRDIALLRTDLDGTVTVWTDGQELSVYEPEAEAA